MNSRFAALALAFCLAGCASAPPAPLPASDSADLFAQLEHHPLGAGEHLRITTLAESEDMSGLLVQIRGSLPLHFHKRTQELLYLLRGEGEFQLGGRRFPVRAGAVIRVPAGETHTFINQGAEPAVFWVVTTPRWDERDRYFMGPE